MRKPPARAVGNYRRDQRRSASYAVPANCEIRESECGNEKRRATLIGLRKQVAPPAWSGTRMPTRLPGAPPKIVPEADPPSPNPPCVSRKGERSPKAARGSDGRGCGPTPVATGSLFVIGPDPSSLHRGEGQRRP